MIEDTETKQSAKKMSWFRNPFGFMKGWFDLVRAISRNRLALVGLVIMLTIIVIAIAAEKIAPYDPNKQNLRQTLLPPAWMESGLKVVRDSSVLNLLKYSAGSFVKLPDSWRDY